MTKTIELTAIPTPNPNTVKFLPGLSFFEAGTIDFPNSEKAKGSVLPESLFQIEGVSGVMIGFNFISVTKAEKVEWENVLEQVRDTITKVLETDKDPIDLKLLEEAKHSDQENNAVADRIKEILDEEIRPAVAMDGGDIVFRKFEDGIVTLFLQGACSTCPASTMTLKMGIENRLKEEFPEDVKEVVQEF